MQWVRLHPYNIAQKVQTVVEHYRENVQPLLEGRAKAMVVAGSRKGALAEGDPRLHRAAGTSRCCAGCMGTNCWAASRRCRPCRAYLNEIIQKVNGLFEGDLTDGDQLVYVNGVLKRQTTSRYR